MPETRKPKRGRPSLPPGERKLASLGFRPTPEIRSSLEAAAKKNCRSVSKEVEARLDRSFLNDKAQRDALGGDDIYSLLKLLGAAAALIKSQTGKSWGDWKTAVAIRAAWKNLIAEASPKLPKKWEAAIKRQSRPSKPLPEPPEAPQPLGVLALSSDEKAYPAKVAAYDAALAEHEEQKSKYARAEQARWTATDAMMEELQEAVGIGERVLGLLPERTE